MDTMTNVKTTSDKTKTMVIIGVMAAVTCILGPLSLAIPVSPIPILPDSNKNHYRADRRTGHPQAAQKSRAELIVSPKIHHI